MTEEERRQRREAIASLIFLVVMSVLLFGAVFFVSVYALQRGEIW